MTIRSPRLRCNLMAVLTAVAVGACRPTPASPPPPDSASVVIDGRFDDWTAIPLSIVDDEDAAPVAAVDLRSVQLHDDGTWLYIAVDWMHSVNAVAMAGTVKLVFDTDGDASTGATINGLAGADAVLELSRDDAANASRHGAGAGIRPVDRSGPGDIESAYAVDLLVGPTTAASRVEMRVRRGATLPGTTALWAGELMRIAAVHEVDGQVVDATDSVDYHFARPYDPVVPVAAVNATMVERRDGLTRVVAWNVAERGYLDERGAFQRVVRALNPDVLLLDEVFSQSTVDEIVAILNDADPEDAAPWHIALALGGGRQKTVVASRLPLRPEPALADLEYVPGSLDLLSEETGVDPSVELAAGLAATGAWVTVQGREVLFVPFDLQSSGYAGSPGDRLRAVQAEQLTGHLADVLAVAPESPIILGGDANAVGSDRPLQLLQQGVPPGLPPLTLVDSRHLLSDLVYTWRNPASTFPPGQLDYLLYGGPGLSVERAFPFEPESLRADALDALGLSPDDARLVSDHLPIVGDFRFESAADSGS